MSAVQQLNRAAAPAVPDTVMAMTSSEWSTALYASDMPTRGGEHTAEQVSAWIVQGVERLGGDVAVWQRTRDFVRVLDIRDDAERARAWRALFPKVRRQDRANDVAWRLCKDLREAGVRRFFPRVKVDLGTDEIGQRWTVEMLARDVEMHERATGEALQLYRMGPPSAAAVLVA
ncbi:hypothetical protein ACWDUI_37925 [Streptosporangium sandarakinum]